MNQRYNPLPTDAATSVLDFFLALVQIDSPSYHEGNVAAAIGQWLTTRGIEYTVDHAADITGCDTGNIIVRRIQDDNSPTLLFIAHMDTVQTVGQHIVPIVGDDGIVRSSGDTILGSDNKAAVAAALYLLASDPPGNIIVVFTTCEEYGLMGVNALDTIVDEIDLAFPVDGSYPVGTIFTAALGHLPFTIDIVGKASHAAKAPEEGIHAIGAASELVTQLHLGWHEDAVLNVGAIEGGGATNVIPDAATITGEIRGYTPATMEQRVTSVQAAIDRVAASTGATITLNLNTTDQAPPFVPAENDEGMMIVTAAGAEVAIPLVPTVCQATLEANYLSGMGLPTIGIASGGQNPHSVNECVAVAELERLGIFLCAIAATASELER